MVTLTKFIYICTFWMFWPHKHADNILRHNVHSMLASHRLQQGLWEGFHSCPSFVDLWLAWFLSKVTQQSSFWSYVWEKLPNSYYQIYCVCCCSVMSDLATAWTVTHQAPLPWDFPGKNTVGVCHSILQGIFLIQGLNPCLLLWQTDSLPLSHQGVCVCIYIFKIYEFMGTSLVVQWLRLHSQWRDPGFDPW